MAVQTETAASGRNWYACTPEEAAAAAGVDPGVGLSAAHAADLLAKNGPNSLPEEKPRPGWRRFLGGPDSGPRPPGAVGTRQVRGSTPTGNDPGLILGSAG
jgi:hypothetical protein